MLDPKVRKYLSVQGKKGGKERTEKHRDKLADWGKKGGLKKGENARKKISEAYNEYYKQKKLDKNKPK